VLNPEGSFQFRLPGNDCLCDASDEASTVMASWFLHHLLRDRKGACILLFVQTPRGRESVIFLDIVIVIPPGIAPVSSWDERLGFRFLLTISLASV
jgi:hypothetical protein